MPGISKIAEPIAKAHGWATKSKLGFAVDKSFQKNVEAALAGATITSIVGKDLIGCFMYVYQSLHNNRIPDEKRKFVASLDLTNGILMILAQLAMFFAMRKYSGPIFNKIFKKSFNAANGENTISRVRMLIDKGDKKAREFYGNNVPKKLQLSADYDKVRDGALSMFKYVVDVAAATIVGKRMIVPLIATPLAKKVEDWMNKRNDKSGSNKNEVSVKNNSDTPSMQGAEKKIDIVSTPNGNTNLIEKYKLDIK